MTNREYILDTINEILEKSDDEKLADVFVKLVGVPTICALCPHDNEDKTGECNCTYYISKLLQSKDTFKQCPW